MNAKHGFLTWARTLVLAWAAVGLVAAPLVADAKRLGGGRASGMQRQMPPKQPAATPDATPNQAGNTANVANKQAQQPANAAAPAAAGAAQQAGKRSWMGPLAGLAAGLGIAALMSHLGLGEAFGNFLLMALLAVAVIFAIRWFMRRGTGMQPMRGPQPVGAGAPYESSAVGGLNEQPLRRQADRDVSAFQPAAAGAGPAVSNLQSGSVPPDFDKAGFERIAKMIFIRLQAANDAGNIDDLRKFTTPELFASLRLDLQERGAAANQTDVMQLDANIVDTAREGGQWIVTVRFQGLIREEQNEGAHPFVELWHLVKPDSGEGEWAIAGITPQEAG